MTCAPSEDKQLKQLTYIYARFNQSLRCPLNKILYPWLSLGEDWSDDLDVQADMNLLWKVRFLTL